MTHTGGVSGGLEVEGAAGRGRIQFPTQAVQVISDVIDAVI
jgi:hypothetical protein